MAYQNRYVFIKRTYPKTIILFQKDNKYIGYKEDKELLKFLKFRKLKDLERLKINYIIVRNMEIIDHQEYENNMYNIYYLRFRLTNLINSWKDLIN